MTDDVVHYHLRDGVGTITLDSPHSRNALSTQVRRELTAHLDEALRDQAVRVIVLTHTGPVFCAGMDLKEAGGATAARQGVHEFPAILERISTSPVPVVARLAGGARAGGIGLLAACDIAVAARSATFAFSEVRIGVVPAVISVTVLPRLRPGAARELFLTGETFDAERAVHVGLLNSAVADGQLDAEVRRYTDMLVLGGPHALAETKRMLGRLRATDLGASFADLLALSAASFASPEGQEGIAAFAQKRRPSWVPES